MATQAQPSKNDTMTTSSEGETIRDLVLRHLRDENHTTTDEELKNARLNLYSVESEELIIYRKP